jgi:hypothetical protein
MGGLEWAKFELSYVRGVEMLEVTLCFCYIIWDLFIFTKSCEQEVGVYCEWRIGRLRSKVSRLQDVKALSGAVKYARLPYKYPVI